ncbi:MAG: SHOCT domain-containing protein [Halanaerobiales bacterium]
MGHYGWPGHMMSWFGGGGGIMMFFWIIIIAIIVYFIINQNNNQKTNRYSYPEKNEESPIKIAERRYARGEIDKEELEEIKRNLK